LVAGSGRYEVDNAVQYTLVVGCIVVALGIVEPSATVSEVAVATPWLNLDHRRAHAAPTAEWRNPGLPIVEVANYGHRPCHQIGR
jgi:hypothetical protein